MTRQPETARGAAAPPTPAGGRMAAEERRRQIVRVAMGLFAERGFRGTTTKEIAQAAGVSEAIIFRHFDTKDDLYTAIIDDKSCAGMGAGSGAGEAEHGGHTVVDAVLHCAADAMARDDDRAVFEDIALTMMEHHQEDPEFLRLLLYSALEGHQLAQIFWDRNVRRMYESLTSYLARRQREGALRADFDPLVVVRAFIGAVIHHSLTNTLWDKDPARRILNLSNEEAARAFTELLLRGIGPAASEPDAKPRPTAAPHRSKKK